MQKTNGTINGQWKMVSVNTLLYDIYELLPNVEMQEEDRIIELLMQAASKLYNHKYYEKAYCLKMVSEHRAELPTEYIYIRSILGQAFNHEDRSSMDSLDSSTTNVNNIIQLGAGVTGPDESSELYSVGLKNSTTIKQLNSGGSGNWKFLQPGTSIMLQLQEQITKLKESGCAGEGGEGDVIKQSYCNTCDHLFSVDTYGRLVTTIHTGLVLVEYMRLPQNEEGEMLIPYHHDMQDAINAYVLYKLSVKNFNIGKQGAMQKMQYWQSQWQMYYLNVKNSLLMPTLSEQIHAIKNRDVFSKDSNTMYSDQVMNPTVRF
jgi:hypothetical protein